jgi:hypothetical protein
MCLITQEGQQQHLVTRPCLFLCWAVLCEFVTCGGVLCCAVLRRSGTFQWKNSFLAHERLAIIDPASGDQPLFNEDRCGCFLFLL